MYIAPAACAFGPTTCATSQHGHVTELTRSSSIATSHSFVPGKPPVCHSSTFLTCLPFASAVCASPAFPLHFLYLGFGYFTPSPHTFVGTLPLPTLFTTHRFSGSFGPPICYSHLLISIYSPCICTGSSVRISSVTPPLHSAPDSVSAPPQSSSISGLGSFAVIRLIGLQPS